MYTFSKDPTHSFIHLLDSQMHLLLLHFVVLRDTRLMDTQKPKHELHKTSDRYVWFGNGLSSNSPDLKPIEKSI